MKKADQLQNLRKKSEKELTKELTEYYHRLQHLKFSQSFGRLKDTHEISKAKHCIAQIWTILRQKYQP